MDSTINLQSLEIKYNENEKENILYVSFRNQDERDAFHTRTLAVERLNITQMEPESMTLKWQNGVISNYNYLLYLNRSGVDFKFVVNCSIDRL